MKALAANTQLDVPRKFFFAAMTRQNRYEISLRNSSDAVEITMDEYSAL